MKKIRVLQVTHDLNVGGLQKLVVDLSLNIDRDVFDIAVCCLRELGPLADELRAHSIPIYEMHQMQNGNTNYLSFMNLYKLLKEQRIDIIHTHNTNPFIDGGIASILAATPVRIHTDHARKFPDKKRYMIAEKILSKFYDKVIAVSEQTKSDLVNYEKINPDKIQVIQNGVSIPTFDDKLRIKNKNRFIIGTVGRLCDAKGYEYLIRSMVKVRDFVGDFELHIVGEGELKPSLQDLINSLNLENHVKLLGERLDMPVVYQSFDLFVISSIREGLPLVLLEAMAYKIPIVTTKVGGIPDVVQDGESAFFVSSANVNELALSIIRAIKNESERDRFSQNAFELFTRRYSIESMMSKYQSAYLKHAKESDLL